MRASRVFLECEVINKKPLDSIVCRNNMEDKVGDIGKLTHVAYQEGVRITELQIISLLLSDSLKNYDDSEINELYIQIDKYMSLMENNFVNKTGMESLNEFDHIIKH